LNQNTIMLQPSSVAKKIVGGNKMKKARLLFSIIAVLSVVALLFTACGTPATPEATAAPATDTKATATEAPAEPAKEIQVAVVLKAINSDYWSIVKAGADAAAKELGVKVEVIGPNAETDIAGQASMMEDQIVKKVSALVVAPSQPSAAIATFDKADAAGIPVLLIDTNADWGKKKSFIGTGNEAGGAVGGAYIASKLQKGDKVAIIRGALGDGTHDDRTNGAKKAMEDAGLEIVTVQPADSDRNKGMSVMENILQANPDVKAVFCSNDEMALGAERAVQQANKKSIIIVGFDASPDALKSILAGELAGSVAQSPFNIGKMGVEAAVKIAKGETIEARIDTGTEMITKDNAQKAQDDLKALLGK
jgi:ribose transport system substrate-binding protein